jgi:hypothetical protein
MRDPDEVRDFSFDFGSARLTSGDLTGRPRNTASSSQLRLGRTKK